MNATAENILIDLVGRLRDGVHTLCDGLADEAATYRIDDQANTIDWLLWHSARCSDAQLHHMIGGDELWRTWRDRLKVPLPPERLGFAEMGYGMTAADAHLVVAPVAELAAYAQACWDELEDYVRGADDDELSRIVDDSYDPPVSAGVRLLSIIEDCIIHLGQAAYIKGVAERAQPSGR